MQYAKVSDLSSDCGGEEFNFLSGICQEGVQQMQTLTSKVNRPRRRGAILAILNGDFVILAFPKDPDSPYCPSIVGQPGNRELDRAPGPIRKCFAADHR